MENKLAQKEGLWMKIIAVVSILIPIAVAFLLFVPQAGLFGDLEVMFLPKLHAIFNSITSLFLIAGYLFVMKRRLLAHKICMWGAFAVSALFLVSYVVYHAQTAPTTYGGEGFIRYIYYFVLITHIVLAAAIVPLVLLTIFNSVSGQLQKHRRIARVTLPIWLYVTITGVIVYFMISPYY